MKKLAIAAAAALAAGTFAMGVTAQEGFPGVDRDGDGAITFEEASVAYVGLTPEVFDQADADDNGTIDENEFEALAVAAAAINTNAPPAVTPSAPPAAPTP